MKTKKKTTKKEKEIMKYKGNNKRKKIPKLKKETPYEISDELFNAIVTMQVKIKVLEEKVDKLSNNKQEPKKEYKRPRVERYYSIGPAGALRAQIDKYVPFDDFNYATGNYYHTNEEAVRARDRQLILQELKDLAMELNAEKKIDWSSARQDKYIIVYHAGKKLEQHEIQLAQVTEVCCLSDNFLKIALERIGEDRLKKLFEEE